MASILSRSSFYGENRNGVQKCANRPLFAFLTFFANTINAIMSARKATKKAASELETASLPIYPNRDSNPEPID